MKGLTPLWYHDCKNRSVPKSLVTSLFTTEKRLTAEDGCWLYLGISRFWRFTSLTCWLSQIIFRFQVTFASHFFREVFNQPPGRMPNNAVLRGVLKTTTLVNFLPVYCTKNLIFFTKDRTGLSGRKKAILGWPKRTCFVATKKWAFFFFPQTCRVLQKHQVDVYISSGGACYCLSLMHLNSGFTMVQELSRFLPDLFSSVLT